MERQKAPQAGDWEGHARVWAECRDWIRSHGRGPHRDKQIAALEGALLVVDPGVDPERISKHMKRHGIGPTTGADLETGPGSIEGARFAGLYAIAAGSDNADILATMDKESPDGIDAATRQRALAMASENGAVKAIQHLAPMVGRHGINDRAPGIDPQDSAHVLEHAAKARTYRQARTVEELLRNGARYEDISKGRDERERGLARHGPRAVEALETKSRVKQIAGRVCEHRGEHPQGKLTLLWRGAGWDIAWAQGRGNRRSGHIAASGLRDTEVEAIMSELGLVKTPRQREKLARDLDSIRSGHRGPSRPRDQGREMR